MFYFLGNKEITQTAIEVFYLKRIAEGRLTNAGDTPIYLDISKETLSAADGGYCLLPGKELPLGTLSDFRLFAMIKAAAPAKSILTWWLVEWLTPAKV